MHVLPVFFLEQVSQNQENEQENDDTLANVLACLLVGFSYVIEKCHQVVDGIVVFGRAHRARLDYVESVEDFVFTTMTIGFGLGPGYLQALQLGQHVRHADICKNPRY